LATSLSRDVQGGGRGKDVAGDDFFQQGGYRLTLPRPFICVRLSRENLMGEEGRIGRRRKREEGGS